MSCKNILKDTVPLEEGRELFSQKKFGGSSKTYRRAKKIPRKKNSSVFKKLRFLKPPPLQEEEYISEWFETNYQ